jgi:hypothetical protein
MPFKNSISGLYTFSILLSMKKMDKEENIIWPLLEKSPYLPLLANTGNQVTISLFCLFVYFMWQLDALTVLASEGEGGYFPRPKNKALFAYFFRSYT